jgi:signal transduction histidine kinase
MMPFPDGFEMRRVLNQDLQLASIPFIFLTARTDVQDRLRGLREGADDYILKPFDADEVLARIEAVIRRVESERTQSRAQMKELAQEEMEKLKQEILQNFQHELTTPLTNILLPLEIAVNKNLENPEEQASFIRTALSNANKLESLTTDLILLSSIDQGNLNNIRLPIDMDIHILGPIQKRLERYTAKELDFIPEIDCQGQICAPRREFTHAILHLVDNALKFSLDKGKVVFSMKTMREGVHIEVRDEGPGIPPDLREKVFERFYQVSNGETRKHDGLGVGLTIARAVFEGNGGYVKIVECAHGCCVQALFPM